jgi:hypothetical protein
VDALYSAVSQHGSSIRSGLGGQGTLAIARLKLRRLIHASPGGAASQSPPLGGVFVIAYLKLRRLIHASSGVAASRSLPVGGQGMFFIAYLKLVAEHMLPQGLLLPGRFLQEVKVCLSLHA